MRRIVPIALLAAASAAALGCKPELEGRESEVVGPRVLAVRSEPAEVAPGEPVSYTALVVDPAGEVASAPLDWAYCTLPRPVAENDDVSVLCFRGQAEWIAPIGVGPAVSGTIPANACRQFGPDVPDGKPGEPPGRPADPDLTGGYYQPLRVLFPQPAGWALTLGQTRIACGLPGATREALLDYQARYRDNENPRLASVELLRGGEAIALGGPASGPAVVAPGEVVTLRASWPACPATDACGDGVCGMSESARGCEADCKEPRGCGGAESYVAYDLASRSNLVRRESMRVSWYAAAGSFDVDRTGRDGDDPASSTDDAWTAPAEVGTVPLWVVLRDDRGGVDYRALRVEVRR